MDLETLTLYAIVAMLVMPSVMALFLVAAIKSDGKRFIKRLVPCPACDPPMSGMHFTEVEDSEDLQAIPCRTCNGTGKIYY
jgi:hypothetical protein